MLNIGDKIAHLAGESSGGSRIKLSNFRGQFLVVYFYPKDNTPGCTIEAQNFAHFYPEFTRRGVDILGVSRDSLKSHANFIHKFSLPFPLISDLDEVWCRSFDVIHEKQLYGRHYLGVVRSTFLIDSETRLRHAWRGVKVPGHVEAVLNMIDAERA